MAESFCERLRAGEFLPGIIQGIPSPEIAEILADAGYQWLFIDLEHAPMGVLEAQAILQTVGKQIDCVVRVPLNDEIWIKKVLDIGAAGVMVPQVNTAEDARRAVRFSKYPPQGTRSVGIVRANAYGSRLQEYLDRANAGIVVVVQVEHILAVENIEAILAVEGINAVFIGPYDMSASMGLIGQVNHPQVLAAIDKVRLACLARQVPLGIYVGSAERAQVYACQGFSLVAISTDAVLLGQAARSNLADLK